MGAYIVRDILHYCNISVKKCTRISSAVIDYYDLTFVLRGSMTYLINGKECVLRENDAILLPPGTLRARQTGTEEVKYVSFNFTVVAGETLPKKYFLQNVISQDIRTLVRVFSQEHISPLYHSREKAHSVLNYILLELLDMIAFESNNQHVIEIIKFIDEHISEQITLGMVSAHVHLSREYIAYIFKKELHKTVIDYVNERKMLIAKNMILAGEASLRDIATNLGYENYSYFSRIFKKSFDVSPARFKGICQADT